MHVYKSSPHSVPFVFCFFLKTDIEVQEMQHSQPESSLMRAEDDDNSSDDELLETQTWRVQRLERKEFLDSLKVVIS